MARIELAPAVSGDLERILDHLTQHEVDDVAARVDEIIHAIAVLEQNPLIGRFVRAETRELVIGRRSRGHVALYRYVVEIDTVFVLAVRNQREAGYTKEQSGSR